MAKPKVFISYSRQDADWARSFAEALRKRDVPVWFDQLDLPPGALLRDAVESALRESDVLVAVIGPDRSEPALYFEVGAAIGMRKNVVPVLPTGVDPETLPFRVRKYLVKQAPDKTADELSQSLPQAGGPLQPAPGYGS